MLSRLFFRSMACVTIVLTAYWMPTSWAAGPSGHGSNGSGKSGSAARGHEGAGEHAETARQAPNETAQPGFMSGDGHAASFGDREAGRLPNGQHNVFDKSPNGDASPNYPSNSNQAASGQNQAGVQPYLFNRYGGAFTSPYVYGALLENGYSPWFNSGSNSGEGGVAGANTTYMYNYPSENTTGPTYSYTYPSTANNVGGGAVNPAIMAAQQSAVDNSSAARAANAVTSIDTSSEANEPRDIDAKRYFDAAKVFFFRGDYPNALRLASHAEVEESSNLKVHELITLSLFAMGNYRSAASEAHATMIMGPLANASQLYDFYPNVETYNSQLKALEKASADKPNDAAERFLLGYQYLMTGAKDKAKAEFAQATKLTPADHLASYYYKELEKNHSITPPQVTVVQKK